MQPSWCLVLRPTRGQRSPLGGSSPGTAGFLGCQVSMESWRTMPDSLRLASGVGNLLSSSGWTFTRPRDSLNAQAHLQGTWGILKLVLIFSQTNIAASVPSCSSMARDLDRHRKGEVEVGVMGEEGLFSTTDGRFEGTSIQLEPESSLKS